MTPEAPTGVLLMAYGTPTSPDDLERYYTDIRGGRPPTADQLADLRRRYGAIGGTSPLADRTRSQARALQAALDRRSPERYLVALGTKHSRPSIDEGVAELAAGGARHAVGLVLAPHYSALSTGDYASRADTAGASRGVAVRTVKSWHLEPGLVALLADRIRTTMAMLDPGATVTLVVTAHSLPARVAETGDPYPDQLQETAEAVTAAAGVKRWRIAWQSAGRTPEPWLVPDLLDVLADVADEGDDAVVVCPAGFTSDHLEVLYDIDVEAQRRADTLGLVLRRTPSLNDDPPFIEALAAVVARGREEARRDA